MPNKPFPFKIGADPEINILIDDRHFNASSLLNEMFSEQLSKKTQGFCLPRIGEIGWDGNDDLAELRPLPENTPKKLTENIETLTRKILEINPMLELSTSCDTGTIGGHIHFELPARLANKVDSGQEATLQGISRKLASFYLPLLLNEDRINIKTRNQSSYGNLTDYRWEKRGNVYTYEYRAPSAEWLTTKEICNATIAYMATVYNEIVYHPENFAKCNGFIFKNTSQANASKELAINDFDMFIKSIENKIKKYIREFEFYPEYKNEIDFILNEKKIKKIKEKTEYNIGVGWNIIKHKQPNKRQLFSRMKKDDNKNIDEITRLIPLYYNEDTNVAKFVNDLKVKMARFNWHTKKRYFLFGLKKGIDDFIITDKNYNFIYGENQIKTQLDLDYMKDTLNRMSGRFPYAKKRQLEKKNIINKNYILIGIPYDLRLTLKSKPLIEHIYKIEKSKKEPIEINRTNLPEEINVNEKQSYGKIYELYKKDDNERVPVSEERRTESAEQRLNISIQEMLTDESEQEIQERDLKDAIATSDAEIIRTRINEAINKN